MKTILELDNIKCGGCANTIVTQLKKRFAVENVKVDYEKGTVEIENQTEINIEEAKAYLKKIGYPEKDSIHGFDKLATNAKSFVSCAIGRMNTSEEN